MTETMTAREGIQELYGRYPIEMDRDNEVELPDCFTEDGVFTISGQGRHVGREEIAELVRRTAAGRPRHYTTNVHIQAVEGDAARSRATFLLVDVETGANVAFGSYTDEPVRCADGRWRFRSRRVQFEWTSADYAAAGRAKATPLPD
ncbi:MAG: nuclear transport factor 2 family protein [Solirubrobacteraceae bacterium]